ncbi:MAG TPA: hypothetical protein VLG12_08315 [Candidatus Saccharimonadales bacterium]|nr:hypothetical protein [Candidatus Saccharimonadales bacterium]
MDPHAHQLSTMDPKLKAAYESVMNHPGSATPTGQAKIPSPGLGAATTVTTTTTTTQPKMITEEQKEPFPEQAPKPVSDQHMVFTGSGKPQTPGTVHIGYSTKPGHKVDVEKKKLNIPPALYIVGCVLFFLLYSIFWVKVFGVAIPFLP